MTAALGANIRDWTPRGRVGHFQGIRMIFAVLLPMVIGPAIGAAVIRGSDSTYVELGQVKTVPTPGIFLAAALVLLTCFVPVLLLLRRQRRTDKRHIFRQFPTDGKAVSFEPVKSGHINETFLVTTDTGARYILQWINQYVFPNVEAIMHNMSRITAFLTRDGQEDMTMIHYIDTKDGKSYYDDGCGGAWRIYRFVENSVCHQYAENDGEFYESGRGFGAFQYALRDFPAAELEETIVDFHNTPVRFKAFQRALEADVCGRRAEVGPEIEFLLRREERACRLQRCLEAGELPIRATHNDTKINNVLMDENTGRALCVIDLDTVMPGLAAYDFGDAIRFGASTAAEDEKDLEKVRLDLGRYRAFARGFLEACPSLTQAEIRSLPQGAYTMTVECGMRFLTDYLMGDKYFTIDYPTHNLDRCRAQFKLAQEMELHFAEMEQMLDEVQAQLCKS